MEDKTNGDIRRMPSLMTTAVVHASSRTVCTVFGGKARCYHSRIRGGKSICAFTSKTTSRIYPLENQHTSCTRMKALARATIPNRKIHTPTNKPGAYVCKYPFFFPCEKEKTRKIPMFLRNMFFHIVERTRFIYLASSSLPPFLQGGFAGRHVFLLRLLGCRVWGEWWKSGGQVVWIVGLYGRRRRGSRRSRHILPLP